MAEKNPEMTKALVGQVTPLSLSRSLSPLPPLHPFPLYPQLYIYLDYNVDEDMAVFPSRSR